MPPARGERSEEHTSELQSLMRISYAVFCLKKKKKNDKIKTKETQTQKQSNTKVYKQQRKQVMQKIPQEIPKTLSHSQQLKHYKSLKNNLHKTLIIQITRHKPNQ